MAKQPKTIQAMDNLTIDEKHREDFIRILKYGLAHTLPVPDRELTDTIARWVDAEEEKISVFEGVITVQNEEDGETEENGEEDN